MQIENQRRISELIRAILALGLEWRPLGPNVKTAINAFYDPIGKKLYTTFDSGLIQRETPNSKGWPGFKVYQGPVNRSQRTKREHHYEDKVYINYSYKVIKLMTEEARLERLLECLTTVKKRQNKTSNIRK